MNLELFEESREVFRKIFDNELSEDEIKSYLIELHNRGESFEEIAGAGSAMRDVMIPFVCNLDLFDNCGTGGDKSGSFNISTTVSFVLAGAGIKVAKHGNRSITSKSGSADMLEYLGVKLDLDIEQEKKLLQNSNFTFLFAQKYHPKLKHIMPIRKSIPHRTIFNILGPLCNPANVKKQLIGVFDKSYIPKISKALKLLDSNRTIVVSSRDGLDEVSVSNVSYFRLFDGVEFKEDVLDPQEYGFKLAPLEAIKGGDAKQNSEITKAILRGDIQDSKRDIVILNSALAFLAYGNVRDIKDGIELAIDTIDSRKAMDALNKVIEVSNKL